MGNGTEHEYVAPVDGLSVTVDKEGGGALGCVYDGDWTVTVMNGSSYVYDDAVLHTVTPRTHEEAARMAADLASAEIDGES